MFPSPQISWWFGTTVAANGTCRVLTLLLPKTHLWYLLVPFLLNENKQFPKKTCRKNPKELYFWCKVYFLICIYLHSLVFLLPPICQAIFRCQPSKITGDPLTWDHWKKLNRSRSLRRLEHHPKKNALNCGTALQKKAYTPWKFNSSPLKIYHPKRRVVFQPSFFRGYVGCNPNVPHSLSSVTFWHVNILSDYLTYIFTMERCLS